EGRRGPAEREVLEACTRADLLILMRDGELRLGPKSLGRAARFVVDHAPCQVVLGWPASPPSVESIRLPSHLREGRGCRTRRTTTASSVGWRGTPYGSRTPIG